MFDFSKYNLDQLRAIGAVMDDLMREDEKLDSWKFAAYVRSTAREVFRAESAAIEQQARDHEAEDAEKVDRFKQAMYSVGKVQLSSIYGTCVADAPPAEDPDELRDLRALVDTLSRCSDRLAALALAEDRRFEKSGQMNTFIKLTVLRNANRSIIDLLADIRDHYDGLH